MPEALRPPRLHLPLPRHDRTAHVRLRPSRCTACGRCVAACSGRVLGLLPLARHRHAHVDAAPACTGCLACVRACPEGAILPRQEIP